MTGKILGVPLVLFILVLLIVLPLAYGEFVIANSLGKTNRQLASDRDVMYSIMRNTTPVVVTPTPEEAPTPTLKQGVRSSATSSGVIK